jgi:Transposase, Mutator family
VQTCLIHLIRNSFRFASRKYWDELSRDLKPIYTAVNAEAAAAAALDDLDTKWGTRYPAIIRLWRNAWEEFIPFLDYDVEIRKVLCSTNAIESLNARSRRAAQGPWVPHRAGRHEVPVSAEPSARRFACGPWPNGPTPTSSRSATARAESGPANGVLETFAWCCPDDPKETHSAETGASQPIPGPAGDASITRAIEVLADHEELSSFPKLF